MNIKKLLTYSFDSNVGSWDRIFRIVTGTALAVAPWTSLLTTPGWASILISAGGLAWLITGLVSRCGMYYLLNYSTRRESGNEQV